MSFLLNLFKPKEEGKSDSARNKTQSELDDSTKDLKYEETKAAKDAAKKEKKAAEKAYNQANKQSKKIEKQLKAATKKGDEAKIAKYTEKQAAVQETLNGAKDNRDAMKEAYKEASAVNHSVWERDNPKKAVALQTVKKYGVPIATGIGAAGCYAAAPFTAGATLVPAGILTKATLATSLAQPTVYGVAQSVAGRPKDDINGNPLNILSNAGHDLVNPEVTKSEAVANIGKNATGTAIELGKGAFNGLGLDVDKYKRLAKILGIGAATVGGTALVAKAVKGAMNKEDSEVEAPNDNNEQMNQMMQMMMMQMQMNMQAQQAANQETASDPDLTMATVSKVPSINLERSNQFDDVKLDTRR